MMDSHMISSRQCSRCDYYYSSATREKPALLFCLKEFYFRPIEEKYIKYRNWTNFIACSCSKIFNFKKKRIEGSMLVFGVGLLHIRNN